MPMVYESRISKIDEKLFEEVHLSKSKYTIVQPKYATRFSCIADRCEDNCCHGWSITVDQKTMKHYKSIEDKEFRGFILKNITEKNINHRGKAPVIEPVITLADDGVCPFIENGLCTIHAKLGEKYLSDTCAIYPRYYTSVDRQIEMSTNPSCIEAARLLLLHADAMELEEVAVDETLVIQILKSTVPSLSEHRNTPLRFFNEIRSFAFDLLKNSTYDLEERLILFGSVASDIDTLCAEGRVADIPIYLERAKVSLHESNLVEAIKEKVSEFIVKSNDLLYEILNAARENNFGKDMEIISLQALVGYGGKKDYTIDKTAKDNLHNTYVLNSNYLNPVFAQYKNMMENLLLSQYFSKLMPNSIYGTEVWGTYIELFTIYKVSTTLLYGIAGCNKAMDEVTAVRFLQLFSKHIFHASDRYKVYADLVKPHLEPLKLFDIAVSG